MIAERYTSESNQRLFYKRWEQFMNAENWEDIPLESSDNGLSMGTAALARLGESWRLKRRPQLRRGLRHRRLRSGTN